MTTKRERRALEKYRRGQELTFRQEVAVLLRFQEAARREGRPVPKSVGKAGEWGMDDGGSGYERDEAKAHAVKTKSFKADLKRKRRLRQVMPGGEATVVRATMAGEGDAGSGEISRMLSEPEAREQSSTLGAGKRDGMGKRTAYCERCKSESHATGACAAVARKKAKEAVRGFAIAYHGVEAVELHEARMGESTSWPASMDGDAAERPEGEDPDGPGDKTPDKEEHNYRLASAPGENCGSCRFFVEPAACLKVEGIIRKIDVCDLFEPADDDGQDDDESEEDE